MIKEDIKKLAEEKIIKRVKELNYSFLKSINYKNCYTDIFLLCDNNHEWNTNYDKFILSKSKCLKCANIERSKKYSTSKSIVLQNKLTKCENNNYTLLKDFNYVNSKITKISLKCNICNYGNKNEWNPTYSNFIIKNHNCPKCSGTLKNNKEDILKKIFLRCEEDNLSLKKDFVYINKYSIIPLVCNKCKNVWNPSYHNFTNGKQSCPKCKESRGEKIISKYLKLYYNNLFEEQKTFNDCKYINKLKFDFYIEKYKIAIEYQGKQHYFESNYRIDDSSIRRKRDNIKKQYCKDNNIFLIEIPYTIFYQNIHHSLDVYFEYYFNCIKNIGFVL
jgi:hypothetical protein